MCAVAHPSKTKRVPLGMPGLASMVSVLGSSMYSPDSSSTLRLCVTFFRHPWYTSSSVRSTVYCGQETVQHVLT